MIFWLFRRRSSQHVCFYGLSTCDGWVFIVARDSVAADFLGRNAPGGHFLQSLIFVNFVDPFYQRDHVRLSVPVVHFFGDSGVVTVSQRVLDHDIVRAMQCAGGCMVLHGQELVKVTEFFIIAGVGTLYILHDEFVVVHELREWLAKHWVEPVYPGHLNITEVTLL